MSEEFSRRQILRNIGISLSLAGSGADVLSAQDAAHVHRMVKDDKAAAPNRDYRPKCFRSHEYAVLRRVCELIIPADEHSQGALEAGAPEFIDLLASSNTELAEIYTGGLAWLEREMQRRYHTSFVQARPEQQTAMLDLMAYRKNESPELAPGIRFFTWARNMTVDAFYTSRIGMDDLGFKGNGAMAEFSVPAEAIAYAVKRSPLA
jgi:hypothetical protein